MLNTALAVYPKILAISQQMAAFAKAENWDALVASERERAALIEQLPNPTSTLAANEARQLAGMINEIMAQDAAVSEHVAPWLEHVAKLLPALAPKP